MLHLSPCLSPLWRWCQDSSRRRLSGWWRRLNGDWGLEMIRRRRTVDYDRVEQALKKSLSNDNEPQWMAVTLTVLTLYTNQRLCSCFWLLVVGCLSVGRLMRTDRFIHIKCRYREECEQLKCTRRLCEIPSSVTRDKKEERERVGHCWIVGYTEWFIKPNKSQFSYFWRYLKFNRWRRWWRREERIALRVERWMDY